MGVIDLSEVINDPDMAETFTILRTTGQFAAGGFVRNAPATLNTYGVVSVATAKDIDALPEGDHINEVRAFWTVDPLYVTNDANSEVSDILVWQGTQYRILTEPDYNNRGYYKALATRMVGN